MSKIYCTVILVDTYDKTPMPDDDTSNTHIRLGNALASSGLSISLTSFCSSMAFFVGSATDIPGISSFCQYAAWSFLTNYILQFLILPVPCGGSESLHGELTNKGFHR